MVNTLIISDRECIKALVGYFQPMILGKIDVAEDFDRGLNEIFNKRPATVFIQSEISGVFAETVIKHIKGLLATDSPKIILLWESDMMETPRQGEFDASFDLSLPEQQLKSSFQKLLMTVPGIQWRTQFSQQGTAPVENSPPSPVHDKAGTSEIQATTLNLKGNSEYYFEDELNNTILDDDDPVQVFTIDLENDDQPVNVLRPVTQLSPLFRIVAVLSFIGLGIAIFFLFSYMQKNDTRPYSSAEIPVPPRPLHVPITSTSLPAANHLFTFIPKQGIDPAYALKKPGWERYVGQGIEYLLFRENGVLKAMQVIAIGEKGISKEFFHAILREVSGGEDFVITSNSVSNGYDVQEGMAAGSTGIAVYTKRKTGLTVAFVIMFS